MVIFTIRFTDFSRSRHFQREAGKKRTGSAQAHFNHFRSLSTRRKVAFLVIAVHFFSKVIIRRFLSSICKSVTCYCRPRFNVHIRFLNILRYNFCRASILSERGQPLCAASKKCIRGPDQDAEDEICRNQIGRISQYTKYLSN